VLRFEDFSSNASEAMAAFAIDSGTWTLQNQRLESSGDGGDAVALFYVDHQLPSFFELYARLSSDQAKAGRGSNAYLVFDYRSASDFKFAGIDISTGKVQIGVRTAAGWVMLVQANMRLQHNREYELLVAIDGQSVILFVDGVRVLSYVFTSPLLDRDDPSLGVVDPLSDGMLGVGSRNAVGRVTRIGAQVAVPEMTFEQTVDLRVPVVHEVRSGTWTVGTAGLSGVGPALSLAAALGIAPLQTLIVETTLHVSGVAGLAFDYLAADRFKFVVLDVTAGKLLLGHRTAAGWFTDLEVTVNLSATTAYTLAVRLRGNQVTVLLNGGTVASHVYHSLVNEGPNGLLVRAGTATFQSLVRRTDDPDHATDVPVVSVKGATVIEGNTDTSPVTIVVELNRPSAVPVTVDWRTEDGSALAGTDYVQASGTITFQPGQTRAEVTVQIIGNTLPEPDKTFRVVLSDPAGALLGTSVATVTILNDDTLTTVTIGATDANLAGLQPGSFTISRDGDLSAALTVRLDWSGTAAIGMHYTVSIDGQQLTSRPATVTLAAGQAKLTITITPLSDPNATTTRTVVLTLAHDAAYRLGTPASATVRLLPDTSLPRLSITSTVAEQHPVRQEWATLTITLSAPATTNVTFTVRTYDGTAKAQRDYRPLTETITFSAGQTTATIRVRILPGTHLDPVYFTVELSNPTGAVLGDAVGVVWLVAPGAQTLDEGTTKTTKKLTAVYAPSVPTDVRLTQAELDTVAAAAIQLWLAAGADPRVLATVRFRIVDLEGLTLAETRGRTIVVDPTAAGHGWHTGIDTLPAPDRMDLLTVLLHELGHVLGYEHHHAGGPGDLMFETLAPGVRLGLPGVAEPARAEVLGSGWLGLGARSRQGSSDLGGDVPPQTSDAPPAGPATPWLPGVRASAATSPIGELSLLRVPQTTPSADVAPPWTPRGAPVPWDLLAVVAVASVLERRRTDGPAEATRRLEARSRR
jgi:hypothetical protein